MCVEIEKAQKEFIKYTENYDLKNEIIKAKQEHSLRVMEISKQIAQELDLSQEEIEVATLIGLLHDIARFEQYTRYGTYRDIESIDHGDIGAEILQSDIRKYIENTEYNETIIKAVKNHNKFKIQEGLTAKQELFAKIIRDADKIDIFYQSVARFWKGKENEVEESIISEYIVQQIKNCSQIKRRIEETLIDNVITVIGFIFDLNFKASFQILKKEDYINKMLNRYNFKDEYTKQKVEEIRKIANGYIKEKIDVETSMQIDIQKAKRQFEKYIQNYNPEDPKIKLKIDHIERVAENSKNIAENLKLKEEDIKLAELIGLLHDIGRFEQIRIYNTFLDKDSINHGEFGVKILFEDGLIREFVETDKFDKIIKLAILNHNRLNIEDGLTEREYLHSQIIRDADKADIYSILISDSKKTIWGKDNLSKEKISDEIYRQYKEEKSINYNNIKTPADLLACHFKFVYDLNFKETKQIIKENQYIDKLYERFTFEDEETIKRYNEIYRLAKECLEKEN